jgi:hypothetical protein
LRLKPTSTLRRFVAEVGVMKNREVWTPLYTPRFW